MQPPRPGEQDLLRKALELFAGVSAEVVECRIQDHGNAPEHGGSSNIRAYKIKICRIYAHLNEVADASVLIHVAICATGAATKRADQLLTPGSGSMLEAGPDGS